MYRAALATKSDKTARQNYFACQKCALLSVLCVWGFHNSEGMYVSTFHKKTENENIHHSANVEQQSIRKGVAIKGSNTKSKPI